MRYTWYIIGSKVDKAFDWIYCKYKQITLFFIDRLTNKALAQVYFFYGSPITCDNLVIEPGNGTLLALTHILGLSQLTTNGNAWHSNYVNSWIAMNFIDHNCLWNIMMRLHIIMNVSSWSQKAKVNRFQLDISVLYSKVTRKHHSEDVHSTDI